MRENETKYFLDRSEKQKMEKILLARDLNLIQCVLYINDPLLLYDTELV